MASVLGRHSNVPIVTCSEVLSSYLFIYLEILHSKELIQNNL